MSQTAKPRTTRVSRHIRATRAAIYDAFLSPRLLATWLAPGTMHCVVHELDAHEGGRFRMTLTYQDPEDGPGGKTTADSDTFHGYFAQLVTGQRVVQVVEFESTQPGIAGEMRVTWDMVDARGGTVVTVTCEDIPPGISLQDNEEGSASSLEKLAGVVEEETDGSG